MENKYILTQTVIRQAGQLLLGHLHTNYDIAEKSNTTDLVTDIDQLIQTFLIEKITSRFPSDTVIGEEGPVVSSVATGSVWFVDPIDGTANFIAQKNDFAILMAYFEDGVGQFALMYDVMRDCLYHGGGAFPVYENDQMLQAPTLPPLQRSLMGLNAKLYATNYGGLADLADQTLGIRSIGSAGLGFSHVLTGRLVAYASYLYPWDYAPAAILGPSLGYQLQTLDGHTPRFDGREHVILFPLEQAQIIQGYLKECNYQ